MRQIVLDTETTGLEPAQGHRIIEIGCVEIVGRRLTGNHYHQYLQPDRDIDEGAVEVHGISAEFLRDKPRFEQVVDDFLAFVGDAELIIHNAAFDLAFLRYELERLGLDCARFGPGCRVTDTLMLARKLHPGQRNSLDALCRRYDVDNSQRTRHGALLDAEILADVYLAMTGGQSLLSLETDRPVTVVGAVRRRSAAARPPLAVPRASDEELASHRRRLEAIERQSGAPSLWVSMGLD